jgi:hypothetical protein
VKLGAPAGDGASKRDHLLAASKFTGELDPQLAEALQQLPSLVRPIWQAFEALCGTRHDGAPIALTEIEAWQRLNGVPLTPWEVETLLAMDQAALSAAPRRPK